LRVDKRWNVWAENFRVLEMSDPLAAKMAALEEEVDEFEDFVNNFSTF
jgi:hypothetical protein